MAVIHETLALEDKFSATFSRFLQYGERAAGASERAGQAARNYQSVLNGLDRRLIGLNAQFSAAVERQSRMVAAGQQNTQAFSTLDARIERLGSTIRDLTAQYDAVEQEASQATEAMRAQTAAADQAAGANEDASRAVGQFASGTKTAGSAGDAMTGTLKRLAGALLSIQTAKWLVSTSDQLVEIDARLQRMTGSAEAAAEANEQIYQAAMRSRGAYTDMADLVSKLGTLAPDAFSDPSGNLDTGELVAFAEQLQKQMALSGTSTQAAQAAMLQLTQAMSSGVLRGEELNSILEQAPMIAQTIADYMGVSVGEMRELASEGAVTAGVVKNALLGAAEETDAAFEQMPMTWGQVWTQMQNIAIRALQPVLDAVNWVANNIDNALSWVEEHMDGVAAVLAGLGAAALVAGGKMVASALMSAAAWAAANWPILLVGASVAALIYAALKAGATFEEVGGVIGGVFGAIYAYAMNNLIVPLQRGFAAIANFIGNVFNNPVAAVIVLFYDMAITVLENIRNLAQGIEDLINKIPGVEVNLTSGIDHVLGQMTGERQAVVDASGWKEYVTPWDFVDYSDAWNQGSEIGSRLGDAIEDFNLSDAIGRFASSVYDSIPPYEEQLEGIGKDVGSIKKSVDLSQEDMQSLVDMAERRYVNNINLLTQAPVINVSGQNTGSSQADRRALANALRDILVEQTGAGSARSTARAYSG